jgi:hypothetical protein
MRQKIIIGEFEDPEWLSNGLLHYLPINVFAYFKTRIPRPDKEHPSAGPR